MVQDLILPPLSDALSVQFSSSDAKGAHTFLCLKVSTVYCKTADFQSVSGTLIKC